MAWRRHVRTSRRCRAGSVALEVAAVAVPFVLFLVGIGQVMFELYFQEALDYSLQEAARQVQLGKLPGTYTAAQFAGQVFCPIFSQFASCTNVAITVQPVTDYYDAPFVGAAGTPDEITSPPAFCVGTPGQLMFAQAVYLAPSMSTFFNAGGRVTVNGATGQLLTSNIAFANENPGGATPASQTGC